MRVYRPDIDGLRALAVGLVVLFHVGVAPLSGGFVGVDVFFVISGYLITGNILEQGKDFRFGNFYLRRIRRLFPAALVVIALTLAASAFMLSGDELRRAARSGIAAIPSLSNFVFWLESGYWDTGAKLKPLLHTWSLAVEEQFYLFWPWMIVGLAAIRSRWAVTTGLALLAVLGLALAEWMIDIAPGAAFYLTPFRATEFALGGLYAAMQGRLPQTRPFWASQLLLAAGTGLVLYAGLTFDGDTRFPGLNAWIPCVGTVLIIAAGRAKGIGRAYDNPISVYLGRISYSLYLTHWPIMALWQHQILRDFTIAEQFIVLGLTVLSAMALFHFVETPFRNPKPSPTRKPLAPAGFLAAALGSAYLVTIGGSWLWATPGALTPVRNGASVAELVDRPMAQVQAERIAAFHERCEGGRLYRCMQIDPNLMNILVIGNSHGTDGYNLMVALYPDANVIHAGRAGCPPLVDVETLFEQTSFSARNEEQCIRHADRIYENEALIGGADMVVFSLRNAPVTFPFFERTLEFLRERTDAQLVILGNGPIFTQDLPLIIRRENLGFRNATVPADYIHENTFALEEELASLAAEHGAIYISMLDVFCPDGVCNAFCDGDLVTYDAHHLSLNGALCLAASNAVDAIRGVSPAGDETTAN